MDNCLFVIRRKDTRKYMDHRYMTEGTDNLLRATKWSNLNSCRKSLERYYFRREDCPELEIVPVRLTLMEEG